MIKSVIYKIQSKLNGKVYVGSAVDYKRRKKRHLIDLQNLNHHSILLQRHYNKYGKDDLVFSILEIVDKKEDLIKREQFYIDIIYPLFNICRFAESCLGIKHTKEQRKAKSKRMQGHFVSKETRIKQRNIALKNNRKPPSRKGQHHTDEAKKKIREKRKLQRNIHGKLLW